MTITQQPDALSLTGNMKSIRVTTDVDITMELASRGSTLLTHTYSPTSGNLIDINIKDIIHSLLSFQLSNQSTAYQQTLLCRTFTVTLSDGNDSETVTFKALRAGVDRMSDTAANFLQHNFLTWQPNVKGVTYYSPEFLTYYAQQQVVVKCLAHIGDNNETTLTLCTIDAGVAATIPVQYAIIAGLTSALPQWYDVWVESSGGTRLTYIQRYYAQDMRSETEDWVLFENSLGGIDTFRAYGDSENTAEHTHNIAEIEEESQEYRVDTERKHKKNTGRLDKKERLWLLDFFPSKKKYIYVGQSLRQIVVVESDVNYKASELPSSYSFTYRYADAKPYLNLPRTDVPLEVLDIEVPQVGSFTVAPRLVEFPTTPLSDGALFPIQDPYSESWGTTTLGAIREVIASMIVTATEGIATVAHTHVNKAFLDSLSWNAISNFISGRYISKVTADTAVGLITFAAGLVSNVMAWFKGGIKVGGSSDSPFGIAANGAVTSDDLHSGTYNDDIYAGSGFHVTKDGNGNGHVFTDFLQVRKKMVAAELEIRKLSYINAAMVQSMAASKIDVVLPVGADGTVLTGDITTSGSTHSVGGTQVVAWRCLALQDDGTQATKNGWKTGDQARCQRWGVAGTGVITNFSNRAYWRLVLRTGYMAYSGKNYYWFDLADKLSIVREDGMPEEYEELFTDSENDAFIGYDSSIGNGDIPDTGDDVVQMGNQYDTDRMGFFITKAEGNETGPYIYAGVSNYILDGKLITKLTPSRVLISSRHLRVFSDPSTGDASPLTHYRGEWKLENNVPPTSYYYDEWDYQGSRWLCIYENESGTTEAPGTTAGNWKKVSFKGDKGDDGKSIPVLYVQGTANTGSGSSGGLVRLFNGTTTIEKKFNDATSVSGYSGIRGILLVTIKRSDLTIEDCLVYDTYAPDPNNNTAAEYGDVANASVNARYALYLKLINLSSDYIVCLVSQDACGWSDRLQAQLKAFGGRDLDVTTTGRYPFAFIGIKGMPEDYALQIQNPTAQSSPVQLSSQIIDGSITTVKDGSDGDDGVDAWTLTVNPSPIIIEQNIEDGSFPFSSSSPMYIDMTAKCGDNAATVGTPTSYSNNLGLTMATVNSGNHRLKITAYGKTGNPLKYVTQGIITCSVQLTYGSRSTTMSVQIPVGVNLLGTWTQEIKDGVETSVSENIGHAIDPSGNIETTQQIGTYIRGWAENSAQLTETVTKNSIANEKNLFGFTRDISYDGAVPFVQGYGFVATYDNSQQYGRIYNIKLNDGAGYYVVSCEVKVQTAGKIRLRLGDVDPVSGSGLEADENDDNILKVSATTSWQKVVAVFNLTAAQAADSNGALVIRGGSSSNYVFIRYLQIERGSTPSLFGICADDAANNSEPMHVTWNQSPSSGLFSDETSGNYGPGGTSKYTTNRVYPSRSPQYPEGTGYIELIKGDLVMTEGIYTLSFWARASVNESVMECFCYDATNTETYKGVVAYCDGLDTYYGELDPNQTEGMSYWGSTRIKLATAWKKYYVHWYMTGASSKIVVIPIRINGSDTGGSRIDYYIAQIKLERGYVTSSNRTVYETVMKQTARRMDFSVLVNSMEKAGIHLYTSNNTTPESEDEIDEGVIDLVAGKVNFKSSNGAVNPYMSIDQDGKLTVDSITATNGDFSGTIHAISGDFTDLTSQDKHVAIVGTPTIANNYWRGLAVGDDPVNGDGDLATIGGRFTDASASTGYGYLVIAKNTGSGSLSMVTIAGNDGSIGCLVLKAHRIETNLRVVIDNHVCDSNSFTDSKVVCNYSGTRTIKLPLATTAREIWVRQIGTGTTNVYDALEITLVGSVTKADGWKLFVYIPQTGWS